MCVYVCVCSMHAHEREHAHFHAWARALRCVRVQVHASECTFESHKAIVCTVISHDSLHVSLQPERASMAVCCG